MLALPKTPSRVGKDKLELSVSVRKRKEERPQPSKRMLELPPKPTLSNDKKELAVQLELKMKEIQQQQKKMLELQDKISTSTRLTLSREKSDLAQKLQKNMEELEEAQKKLLELHAKSDLESQLATNLELQIEEKEVKLVASNRERDKLEREIAVMKSDVAALQRTLQLERQDRKVLEETALSLIRSAKQKWEAAERDKIARLNKHIESQTARITELCTSNNELTSKLQRTQCDLETANAELKKLREFQAQYKESLAKTRELRRQSVQGVENKLEEISVRAHNQLAEVRMKLEQEIAKSTELESTLRNERDAHHCKLSRLNVALELAQSELKDCQEQLRATQAMIPARDQEIDTLKNQLKEKLNQLDSITIAEQTIAQLQEQLEKVQMENEQMKNQLEATRSDLNDTLMNLRRSETLADDLQRTAQDKDTLQQRLRESQEKEDEQLRKVDTLEELLQRLQQSVAKLESENAQLKRASASVPSTSRPSTSRESTAKAPYLESQVERLEKQLATARDNTAAERETARAAQRNLWKKEKELADANLDKRIAQREVKTAEEKIKKLEEDKQRLTERLNKRYHDDEEKSKKLLTELESAKSSLAEVTREASRNKLQADSAQRALTQANKQIEELQSSSAALRRELDAARKQVRTNQDRVDSLNAENKRLTFAISKHNEEKSDLEAKLEKLEQEAKAHKVNIDLLKETCTVLEEQLTDYERLTSDHETRENTLVQEKMRLQKELETVEQKLRETDKAHREEKSKRLVAERAIERLESETSDIEGERNNYLSQRNEYKKLAEDLNAQVASLTSKCGKLECDIAELKRALENARGEAVVVKEESTQHLTRLHELKDINQDLMADLQSSIDQGQELRVRIAELESVLEEMRQFYQEHEMKSEGTRQQQTKLIDYLQLKLEECSKKKRTVCERIFRTKQKDAVIPTGTGMPVGYRELENQLARERAKVKTLTEQLLELKAMVVTTAPVSPPPEHKSPEYKPPDPKKHQYDQDDILPRQSSLQRIRHNIPHRFNVELSMRAGKCAACLEPIQFGKRCTICSECQIMTHLKCSLLAPASCGLPGGLTKHLGKNWRTSDESISTLSGSVQTLTIDEPDHAELDAKNTKRPEGVGMESWVKVPGRGKASWERKYLRLEGSCLNVYEHQPSPGMAPISRMELTEKDGFTVNEDVHQAEVLGTAKSDLPFIFRVESNTSNTCWPTNRLDIMALSQVDKKSWLNALKTIASQNGVRGVAKSSMMQSVVRLEKNRLDLNCVVELEDEGVLLIGAEEGLYSYRPAVSKILTAIRGVKRVHQLTIHPHLGLALMIAGEDRQLVSCDLRQLKSNAVAAEFSRPAISTSRILTGSESCHLYQLEGEMLCAATTSQVVLLKWKVDDVTGEFIPVKELETQEPCSCAIFTRKNLIVGCQKFFQIDLKNYGIDDFPEEDDSSVKAALAGVAKLGIFPVAVLNVSGNQGMELLLCYNEFGVFVNENGQRTRCIEPTWSHMPFAFAFRRPYLFIVHFSSVEVIKLTSDAFKSPSKNPERTFIDLNNPRYLGLAGSRGIYVAVVNSTLDIQRIDGAASILSRMSGSLSSLESLCNNDDSSSEFSFTPSLMETLDNPGKRVHFANLSHK